MKKIVYIFSFIAFCFSVLLSQPKDVPGFMNTRWGMTDEEILKAMKDDAVKLKSKKMFRVSYANVGLKEITIDSNKFIGYFLMNEDTKTLSQVNLNIVYQHLEDNFETYESLKKYFIKEYGNPTRERSEMRGNSHNKALLWIFPSTVILVSAWGNNLENLMIQYFKNVGKTPEQFGFKEKK